MNLTTKMGKVDSLESETQDLARMDRETVLHPFTPVRAYEKNETGGPRFMESGKGIRITDADGNTFIDGLAGGYCGNSGYGRQEVAEAIAERTRKRAYYHSYAGHTTKQLARLSHRLVNSAPGNMVKVF